MARKVVIAEDEAIVRLDLRELLEEEGYEIVGETGRGDEAVALAIEHEPDLVILDIKMPGMDGLAAAREIALQKKSAVLVLTAFSQRNLVEEARDSGVLAYLVKPFQKNELLPQIEVALGRFAELSALEAENASLTDDKAALERQLETRRWVDRAKGKLMDEHHLKEAEAFSFIQQTAMNNRETMLDVARRVVENDLSPESPAP